MKLFRAAQVRHALLISLSLMILTACGLLAVAQRSMTYQILVGREEGWHSDLPLVSNWNTAQRDPERTPYRWSGIDSVIRLPTLGSRPLLVTIDLLATAAHPAFATGSVTVTLAQAAVHVPLNAGIRTLHLIAPPGSAETPTITVAAPLFEPEGDPRTLGVPVSTVTATPLRSGLFIPPVAFWWPLMILPLVALVVQTTVRRPRPALIAGLGIAAGCIVLAALDPPRYTLAGRPLLIALLWGIVLGIVLDRIVHRMLGAWQITISPATRRTLVLIWITLWTVRYAVRLYPEAMIGDLGFHVNRLNEIMRAQLYIVSRHRAIDFPYPSGLYVLLQPLMLLPITVAGLVEWSDALLGSLGIFPLAYLGWAVGRELAPQAPARHERLALFAAAAYAALAPAIMALFWSFLPHIFTQEAIAIIIAALIGGWPALDRSRGFALALLGFVLIFFGHIGLYINLSLLIGCVVVVRWWDRTPAERRRLWGLVAAFGLAQALALILFYSGYTDLILAKLAAFGQGGMSAVQENRATTSSTELLNALWTLGLGTHYAWIGLPLGLVGGIILLRRLPRSRISLFWWSTFAVALIQALIPFLTASTISTRWLSFSAWIIALGLAVVADLLWPRSRPVRLLIISAWVWIAGSTFWIILTATTYRIRPPEPF